MPLPSIKDGNTKKGRFMVKFFFFGIFIAIIGGISGAKIQHDYMLSRYDAVCAAQEHLSVCSYYEAAMNGSLM